MELIKEIETNHEKYTNWRREIHAYPELAYQEHRTSDFVAKQLQSFGIHVERGLGKTGVVGTLQCGTGKRAIGLRADMDALPLSELNDFGHKSLVDGVMHACGHDGHTTMLLAAAECLAQRKDFDGTIHFIFQPAEEGEAGAEAMMKDGLFRRFPVESVFAIHNWPGLPVGEMATREGPIMAALDTFKAEITGKGGHAALPHLVRDPIQVASQIVMAWQTIVSRNVKPIDPAVLSVTRFHGGTAWAVVPEIVELGGTVRTFSKAVQSLIADRMLEVAEGLCSSNGCKISFQYERRYPATLNSPQETQLSLAAARDVCGDSAVDSNIEMVTGSEDFGFMLQEKPGCYAFIGNGPGSGGCLLHSPHFDFNDDAIPVGGSYWVNLVYSVLGHSAD